MNDKKEIILLDARIVGVIDKRAFYAVLRNDHRFVAFVEKGKCFKAIKKVGDKIRVKFSPFDMSKGEILV